MRTKTATDKWAATIDRQYADLTTTYGAYRTEGTWHVNLWQPLAQNVTLIIFDRNDPTQEVKRLVGKFKKPNWTWTIAEDVDGYFYQYLITHHDGHTTYALDPYAKSMAPFDWQGTTDQVGKAAFVDWTNNKPLRKLNQIHDPYPIIYEAHLRDLTSLHPDVKQPGSFNAVIEANIAQHLQDLGFNTLQLMPVTSCYALNETDQQILKQGQGTGWTTNYNWGYDPHHYFTLNGWFASNPHDPYNRMNEFGNLVQYFHDHNINVVVDVVYNHLMINKILDHVFPEYYFRGGSSETPTTPVTDEPSLATERIMCRRLIIDSLRWLVTAYDLDGFRFDLMSFIDQTTLEIIAKELRALKPHLILHGEAWAWTALDHTNTLVKGTTDNDLAIAYFNDSTRNAIKGVDDTKTLAGGILGDEVDPHFGAYLSAIIGNIKTFDNAPALMENDPYVRFTDDPGNVIQYSACHDGHTLWDKINLVTVGTKQYKFEKFRQALMMQLLTQGRMLFLGGTEMLATKPHDHTGHDSHRHHTSDNLIDLFELGPKYHENSYKTTDWTNGLRWEHLTPEIKTYIYDFLKKLIHFRKKTQFFNLNSSAQINQAITFNHVDRQTGIIDFSITLDSHHVRVIHNFKDYGYQYDAQNSELFADSMLNQGKLGWTNPHSSQLLVSPGGGHD